MALLLLCAGIAQAATLQVDSSGSSGTYASISDAISAASDGDTIEVAAGTWYDCLDYDGKSLSIVGTSGSGATTLDAAGTCAHVVDISSGEASASLQGFSVRNHARAGVLVDAGTVTLSDLAFSDMGTTAVDLYVLEVLGGDVTLSDSSVDTTVVCADYEMSFTGEGNVVLERVSLEGTVPDSNIYADAGTLSFVDADLDGWGVYPTGIDIAISGGTWSGTMLYVTSGDVEIDGTSMTGGYPIYVYDGNLTATDATFANKGVAAHVPHGRVTHAARGSPRAGT